MKDIKVKSSKVLSYLGVKHPTFLTWIRAGVLGEAQRHSGRGVERKFNFTDICTLRLVRDILRISPDLNSAHQAALVFRESADQKIKEVLSTRDEPVELSAELEEVKDIPQVALLLSKHYKLYSTKESPNLVVYRSGAKTVATFMGNTLEWLRTDDYPEAIVIVPIDRLVKETLHAFPQFTEGET